MIKNGYKCLEQDPNGGLHALFIDRKTVMPVGEWIKAEVHPTNKFSLRPGLHVGEIPDCPWIKSYDGSDTGYYKGCRKGWKRVFAEIEYVADNDYTEFVQNLPKKCFTDHTPTDGFYTFKEAGVNRVWVVCDKMKITKVLTESERQQILNDMEYDEIEAFSRYKTSFEKRLKIS